MHNFFFILSKLLTKFIWKENEQEQQGNLRNRKLLRQCGAVNGAPIFYKASVIKTALLVIEWRDELRKMEIPGYRHNC
jgi:hypothetical protein